MNGILHILLRHDAWATRTLILASRPLSHDHLHQRFDIGPGSIHDTLAHIIGAMVRWSDRISGRPLRTGPDRTGTPLTPDDFLRELDIAADDLYETARRVDSEGRLDQDMTIRDKDGRSYTFSHAAALVHVTTHGMHHRAQVLNMRRRLGLPPLGLDLDPCEWEMVERGTMDMPDLDR